MRGSTWTRAAVALGLAGAGMALVGAGGPAGAQPAVPAGTPGTTQLVVKLAPTAGTSVLAGLPVAAAQTAPGNRLVLRVATSEAAGVLGRLRADHGVRFAEASQLVHADDTSPNDPCYVDGCTAVDENDNEVVANQADLASVDAAGAWAVTHGSPNVTVAVLDTGVDASHPDLAGQVTVGPDLCPSEDGPDFMCGGTGDGNGHGTHTAGTVAAATDNGTGVASLGWNTHVLAIKVLDDQGAGTTAAIATGIYDAVAAGARVISMSLSNSSCDYQPTDCGPDPDTESAVQYALAHNVVMVAAAGNDGSTGRTYPSGYPGVLSVAATDDNGVVQDFSEHGDAADIAAPGLDVVSTIPPTAVNGGSLYGTMSGTSMATPHVAAAAALMLAVNPALTGPQVASLLIATARPTTGGPALVGGELDAGAAVRAALAPPTPIDGYHLVTSAGNVAGFGAAPGLGDLTGTALARPVVGMSDDPDGLGYRLVASDGGVFTFGDAGFYGSTGALHLNRPVVGMASTPDGRGYWLVASDGGVFTFGDAGFHGSTGALHLNAPIVGMRPTPDGGGYWLVASDGGIFTFGDAGFHGSTGALRLNQPVVGMASTPDGGGYWLVASDGGIFAFGDANFAGSTGALRLNAPIVGMRAAPDGVGYWLAAADGGIFTFGDTRYLGSAGGEPIPAPVVGIGS